jgi:hypothetical protein
MLSHLGGRACSCQVHRTEWCAAPCGQTHTVGGVVAAVHVKKQILCFAQGRGDDGPQQQGCPVSG